MRNAAAPRVGGDRIAPMPAADRMAPPTSAGYPRLPQQRPRDGAQHDGGGDAAAGHRAEQKTGQRHGAARAGAARDRPIAAVAQSRKKVPAPEYCSTAP